MGSGGIHRRRGHHAAGPFPAQSSTRRPGVGRRPVIVEKLYGRARRAGAGLVHRRSTGPGAASAAGARSGAAGEWSARGGQPRRHGLAFQSLGTGGRIRPVVAPSSEDCPLWLDQRGSGLQAELVVEDPPVAPHSIECVGPPVRAPQRRGHQLRHAAEPAARCRNGHADGVADPQAPAGSASPLPSGGPAACPLRDAGRDPRRTGPQSGQDETRHTTPSDRGRWRSTDHAADARDPLRAVEGQADEARALAAGAVRGRRVGPGTGEGVQLLCRHGLPAPARGQDPDATAAPTRRRPQPRKQR
jgi:hypothetical protein